MSATLTGVFGMPSMPDYVQPIAQHVDHPQRLLLQSEDGTFYLWSGDRPHAQPEPIEPGTAEWLQLQPHLRPLPHPRIWLHTDDLPVTEVHSREQK